MRRQVARHAPLGPAIVLLGVFFAGPVIWSLYLAFTNMALTGAEARDIHFIGLANFQRMLSDSTFINSLKLTVLFVLGSAVVGQNTLGLVIALLLRERSRVARQVITTVVIAAWVMPEIVAAYCWLSFLSYPSGTLNQILGHFGTSQNWLYTSPMLAIILANIWRGTAFSLLVYSAALGDVSPELLEAAAIDGAGLWQRLIHVILPVLRRAIVTNLMLITLQTLGVFGLIFALTGGGPGILSQTTPVYMYRRAFELLQLGYGCSMALVLLLVGAVFSLIYLRLIKVERNEPLGV